MLRRLALTIGLVLCGTISVLAQGVRKDDFIINQAGKPIPNAAVTICTTSGTGTPCTPLASIYSDEALTVPIVQPILTGPIGNFGFYVAPGEYIYTVTGASIAPVTGHYSIPCTPTASVSGCGGGGGGGGGILATDNAFTNNNRFKGPIPYRDVTAYMPAGGCDASAGDFIFRYGTINATSTSLAISSDNHFKNGCGVFVVGAGAASTLATPAQGVASNPVVIGTAGSTTVHYKVAAIDANYGTSAASTAITVTTAPAARTALNYVGLFWTGVANAVGYLVYTDTNGGGTYVPLGYSFDCTSMTVGSTCGAIDKGVETNTWTVYNMWPLTPPSGDTNQALITTIVSGAGTLNLTLAAPATNSVTTSFTMPDNAPFFQSAIADASNDGDPFDKGTVFIPNGLWFASTLPFPSTGTNGINFILSGKLQVFGLPIMGPLSGGGTTTGQVAFEGHGGMYKTNDWSLTCANIYGYPSLGSIFLVSNGSLALRNICMTPYETGIVSAPGSITAQDLTFSNVGSGPDVQIDNNAFFTLFERTNWNTSTFNPVWLLGLTNNAHSSVFDFRDNSFISHTIRYDQVFPSPGYFGNIVIDGSNDVEDTLDHGFINVTTNGSSILNATIDNLASGDALVPNQYVFYTYSSSGAIPGVNVTIHGQTVGYNGIFGSTASPLNPVNCRAWTYENSNSGGAGNESIGYYGNVFGTYSGCDLGMTATGYDVQTTEVLVSGGNDPVNGSAGEQIIGHIIRRPIASYIAGAGSLSSGTYYIQVTMVDVAGRESAPSPEIAATVGASSSIAVTATTQIYYPSSCKVYFGTTPGGEANYFSSTSVTNGVCTYTLTTTAGETAGTPQAVGNAMRTWFTAENNANSCLFCGFGGGLGTGFLGINLTSSQYNAPPSGVNLYFNGKMALEGLATSGSVASSLCQDASGNVIAEAGVNCYAGGGGGGAVSSVFGRTGAVAATNGDYSCSLVTNCPAVPISIANGGTGTSSTLTGLVRGSGSAMTAAELSGDATTSGSNAVTVGKINGTSLAGLATGILKNTTATGVPSIATSSDIIADFSGTCNSSTYLSGSGACSTPGGSVSGQANGVIPLATGSTSITAQSHCDDGNTTAATVTCSEPFTSTGAVNAASDGTHAGMLALPGNTANYSIPSNSFGLIGPSSASFTSWFIQPNSAGPANKCIPTLAAVASQISAMTCASVAEQDTNNLITTPADGLKLFNTTAASAGVPVQYSPNLHLEAQVWNTTSVAANNAVDWIATVIPVSGTNPTSSLRFQFSLNGGAYTTAGMMDSFQVLTFNKYNTTNNCSSSASPAVCSSASAGTVALPTGTGSTLQVNTSAVTANSQIFLLVDDTLGSKLGITCNSTLATLVGTPLVVTARSAGTSFTISTGASVVITANPVCLSYLIVN